METMSLQPLVLVHNNEIVSVENNHPKVLEKNFSSFKIFKLKGPIDTDYLLNIIFPPSEKDCYNLEVTEYDGKSAKVKFYFIDRTHTDVVTHLLAAAANLFDVCENGLNDWLASDTVTFKTIYKNIDANKPLGANGSIENHDSTSSLSTELYPVADDEAIERELEELSKKISSQTFLTNYELERLFHKTFGRRDMTVTISDVYEEYFSQIEGVVGLMVDPSDQKKLIEEGALSPKTVIGTFAFYLYNHLETLIRSGSVSGFVKDYKFGIVITIWNIINACHSIQVSYDVLLKSDEEFKQILMSKRPEFENCILIIDEILMDILDFTKVVIDSDKYKKLQRQLCNFIKAAESLMKHIMIISKECDEKLKKLEDQGKVLSSKLWTVATTIGISAVAVGGAMYFRNEKFKKYEKLAMGAIASTAAATVIAGCSAKDALQGSIEQQTNVLIQLNNIYSKLQSWKNLSHGYTDYDINDINNNRMILNYEFGRVKLQCQSLGKVFDMV